MIYKEAWLERDYDGSIIAYISDGEGEMLGIVDAREHFGEEAIQEFLVMEENERIGFYLYQRYKNHLPASIADYWL